MNTKGKDSKRTLIKSGIILTVFGVIAKGIGLFYRIPLTNLLGAKGMGVYQMIFPVYALLVAIVSSAVPVLVSRNLNALGDSLLKKGFFTEAFFYSLYSGLIYGAGLIAVAKLLGLLQGNVEVESGYYMIAPAVLFVSVLSAFRGWFNSCLNTIHTAITGLFEQLFKLTGIVACYLLRLEGIKAVNTALLGISLSELVACLYALIVFLVKGGRLVRGIIRVPFSSFVSASIPLTVGGLVFPLALFADSILVTRLLAFYGLSEAEAITEYGIFSGAVGTLINVPQSLAISFAVTMIPVVARQKKERNIKGVKKGEMTALKAVLIVALPCTVALFVLANRVIAILYPAFSTAEQSRAVFLLKISVVQIPILSVLQLFGSFLQALDKGVVSAKNMLIACVIKLGLNFTCIRLGIEGIILANTACYIVCAGLDIAYGYRLTGKTEFKSGIPILFASLVMGGIMLLINKKISNNILSLALSLLIGGAIYVIILLIINKLGNNSIKKADRSEGL